MQAWPIVAAVGVGAALFAFKAFGSQGDATTAADTSGQQIPDNPPADGVTVGAFSAQDIAGYAVGAGFSGDDLTTIVAIALAESGGDPGAVGDKELAVRSQGQDGPSIGLWQINIGRNAHPEFSQAQLKDPMFNARVAFQFYTARRKRGQTGFEDWSTWLNNRTGTRPNSDQYLAQAQEATASYTGA